MVKAMVTRATAVRLILVVVLTLLAAATHLGVAGAQQKTLGQIRKELLGTEVVILGPHASGLASLHGGNEMLLHWHETTEAEPSAYRLQIARRAPYSLKGRRGTVVSIQRVEQPLLRPRGATKDVFGDAVAEENAVNPYFELFVKLPDDVVIGTRTSYVSLFGSLELAVRVEKERREIENGLPALVGRTIYPVGYSSLFPADVELGMLGDLNNELAKLRGVPNLTPLKIVRGAYVGSEHAAVVKVEFGNGQSGIIFSRLHGQNADRSVLNRVAAGFLMNIPDSLTPAEIDAIKRGTIFRGMSLDALHYTVGFPDKENDWGRGGQQLIYGKHLMVYIQAKKVVEWQSLSR